MVENLNVSKFFPDFPEYETADGMSSCLGAGMVVAAHITCYNNT